MTTPSPEQAAAALLSLPGMSPLRLRTLLDCFGGPVRALDAVAAGRALEALPSTTVTAARRHRELAAVWTGRDNHDALWRLLERRGTHVWIDGVMPYPIRDDLPHRPPVLLAEGARPDVLTAPRVAVIGTRAATPHGLADARELGGFLAAAGLTVVSGMAIGIDGAAHEGAIAALAGDKSVFEPTEGTTGGPVGVVATGLDIEYPRRHTNLYAAVRRHGVVVGETAFGVRPARQRFPIRNRIIAALADVVVVVEATLRGGARITAQFALDYGRTVLAVPGSRRNPAAAGTNALIADGAHPLVEWEDVLLALGLSEAGRATRASQAPSAPAISTDGVAVLRALGGEAATPDDLSTRSGLSLERTAAAIAELERTLSVERSRGVIWAR